MTIKQIYSQFQIPQNLRLHMLRVASLAKLIVDNWQGETLNQQDVVICAALHDIAKPITFDPDQQKQFIKSEQELSQVINLIINMKEKYGLEEHPAAVKIFQEVGCNKNTIRLIENLEWIYLPRLLKENDLESLILTYVDMRVGPKGILSLEERLKELAERAGFEGMEEVIRLSPQLEKTLQEKTEVNLNSISDEQIDANFQKILNSKI